MDKIMANRKVFSATTINISKNKHE